MARTGADDETAFRCCLFQCRPQILGLVKRAPFVLVSDHIIQLTQETAKIVTVAIDAERVREGDPGLAAARPRGARRRLKRRLAFGLVKKITLQEQKLGLPGHRFGHICVVKFCRNAQIGIHRALAIGRDKDHRPRGGQHAIATRRVDEVGANLGHRRGIVAPEFVIADPPDKSGREAKRAQSRYGIGDRPARGLPPVGHVRVEKLGAFGFDQLHDALVDTHARQKGIVALADHVHHGIADADGLISGHSVLSSNKQRSRIRQVPQAGLRALQV